MRDSVKYLKSEYSSAVKSCTTSISEHESYVKKFDAKLSNLEELRMEVENSNIAEALDLELDEIIKLENEKERNSWEIVRKKRDIDALDKRLKDIQKKIDNPNETSKCNYCGQSIQSKSHPELYWT